METCVSDEGPVVSFVSASSVQPSDYRRTDKKELGLFLDKLCKWRPKSLYLVRFSDDTSLASLMDPVMHPTAASYFSEVLFELFSWLRAWGVKLSPADSKSLTAVVAEGKKTCTVRDCSYAGKTCKLRITMSDFMCSEAYSAFHQDTVLSDSSVAAYNMTEKLGESFVRRTRSMAKHIFIHRAAMEADKPLADILRDVCCFVHTENGPCLVHAMVMEDAGQTIFRTMASWEALQNPVHIGGAIRDLLASLADCMTALYSGVVVWHGDLHSNNVCYNSKTKKMLLIDTEWMSIAAADGELLSTQHKCNIVFHEDVTRRWSITKAHYYALDAWTLILSMYPVMLHLRRRGAPFLQLAMGDITGRMSRLVESIVSCLKARLTSSDYDTWEKDNRISGVPLFVNVRTALRLSSGQRNGDLVCNDKIATVFRGYAMYTECGWSVWNRNLVKDAHGRVVTLRSFSDMLTDMRKAAGDPKANGRVAGR